jgi:hypothetical protein
MKLLGPIVRLQVQQSRLKVPAGERKVYDPTPIRSLASILVTDRGIVGLDDNGSPVPDVHHADHPMTRNNGANDLSLGFTSHYGAMRDRFGDHLHDGVAGESILVEVAELVQEETLHHGVTIRTATGIDVHLGDILVAEPCVEFTGYALRNTENNRAIAAALPHLRHGMRGFYARYHGPEVRIAIGDQLFASEPF